MHENVFRLAKYYQADFYITKINFHKQHPSEKWSKWEAWMVQTVWSSHHRCSVTKVVLKNIAKTTGKHLRQSFLIKLQAEACNFTLFFYKNQKHFAELQCSYLFSSIWASNVLIPVLIHPRSNKLQFLYLTIISHLACWKSRNFPFMKGTKEILKNFPKYKSIIYNKLLIGSKQLLW